jgi:tetratricopeptide (TPR) repeat protein
MVAGLPEIDSLWNFGNPAETEAAFRALLPSAESEGEPAYLGELLTQIARTEGLQRKFEDAHATLDRVEALGPLSGRVRLRFLLERGRVHNSSGSLSAARPLFVEAWELGREIGEDALAVDAAHMVAIVEAGDEALRWNLLALDLAMSSPEPRARRWRKSLHNNLGWTYFDAGQTETALDHFQRCLECSIEYEDEHSAGIARWSIGKAMRVLGQVEEALAMQRARLAEVEANGGDPGYACEEIGECLYALGRIEEAKPYFGRSYAALSADPWLATNEPERLKRLHALS